MTIPKNVLFGFVLAFIVVLAIGVYSFIYFRSIVRLGHEGAALNEVTLMVKEGKAMVSDLERNALSYHLTGQSSFMNHFEARSTILIEHIEKLEKVAEAYPSFHSSLAALKDSIASYVDQRRSLVADVKNKADSTATYSSTYEGLLNSTIMLLNRIEEQATAAQSLREETLSRQFYQFVFVFAGLLVLAVIAIGALLYTSNAAISVRMLSEERLRRTNLIINELYENAPCGYLSVNQEGMVTACNQTILEMLGYEKREVEDRMHISGILPSWKELIEKYIENDGETSQASEPEMVRKSGEHLIALASIASATGGDDRHYHLTVVDYTERKKYRDQLVQNNQDLEAFSYSVSHDLKAPLRAVNSYSAMLQEDFAASLTDDGRQLLDTIVRNARNMSMMIEDLLRLSKMGQQEVIESDINMDAMVQNAIKSMESQINSKTVVVVKDLGHSKGDIGLMKQVWINLISNAVKYSGTVDSPQIEIGVDNDGNERVFYIKDNGAGFDMQYYGKLFGVFQRLHSKRDFDGTGVGLSIVKRIINKHQGRIWATSTVGEGATFYFTFRGA